MELEFLRNVMDVDVDAMQEVNTYTIKAMYNKVDKDGFAAVTHKLINKIKLTWNEIEEKGGVVEINRELRERYKIEKF